MADPGVAARPALADRAGALAAAGAVEVAFLAQVDLRVDPAKAPAALGLPLAPNTWAAAGDREALWLGPDQWLMVGPPGSAPAIGAGLQAGLAGRPHSVVDVSANRAVVDLGGPDRLELLAVGCGLDLHPRAWGPGRCAQTLLARVPVLLQERDGATRLFVRPSFAAWLLDWLAAARSP
jgi:sarcosine oxidase, subunit gamma